MSISSSNSRSNLFSITCNKFKTKTNQHIFQYRQRSLLVKISLTKRILLRIKVKTSKLKLKTSKCNNKWSNKWNKCNRTKFFSLIKESNNLRFKNKLSLIVIQIFDKTHLFKKLTEKKTKWKILQTSKNSNSLLQKINFCQITSNLKS